MIYRFPYSWASPVEVPEMNLIGVFEPRKVKSSQNQKEVIKEGLANPIGSERLSQSLKKDQKILILVDDMSRPTPSKVFLPQVLNEVRKAGIRKEDISFLVALGTHREMTEEEMTIKFGRKVCEDYEVVNHDWKDPRGFRHAGLTRGGTEILVNKKLSEADFVIGVGNIVPHPAAGFGGGGKIVDPGVVSEETCGEFHWESVHYPQEQILGRRDHPIMKMIDEVAERAGLKFIVNTILDDRGEIYHLVAGHPKEAHEAGCKISTGIYGVEIPRKADIVIADSHPADLEMWQAIKGLCTSEMVLSKGGIVIFLTPCPEGVSKMHPELSKYGYRNLEQTSCLLEQGKINKVVGHHMVQGGRLLDKAETVYLISPCLTPKMIKKIGFTPATSPQAALESALHKLGNDASIIILKSASELLPVVGKKEKNSKNRSFKIQTARAKAKRKA